MLADAFVILGSLLLVAAVLTQILVPLIQNKPLFCSFRRSYQRERWLKQQLEETKRRMAELELEKQLADHRNELFRRQMEQMRSLADLGPSATDDRHAIIPRKDVWEKER